MKKYLALMMALTLLAGMLAGCSGNTAAPAAGNSAAPAAASEEKAVELSLSIDNYSTTSVFGQSAQYLKEKLEEYSNGSITVNIFSDSSMGDTASQVQAIQGGALDMLVCGNSYYSKIVPEMQAFEIPFIFDGGKEQARKVLDGEAGQYAIDKLEGTGIKLLRFWEVGVRQLTNNTKPIQNIDDLQGLLLRVLPVDLQVKAWEIFGAAVTPVDGSELFTALQQGVVEGQENPLEGIYANKIYEVQKYCTLTGHVFTPAGLCISETTWGKLSQAQQEAVVKAVDEATSFFREKADAAEEAALQGLKDAGMEFVEDPDLSGFIALAPQVQELFTQQYGTEIIELIEKSK